MYIKGVPRRYFYSDNSRDNENNQIYIFFNSMNLKEKNYKYSRLNYIFIKKKKCIFIFKYLKVAILLFFFFFEKFCVFISIFRKMNVLFIICLVF